jgi:inorganic pyrophosphatase
MRAANISKLSPFRPGSESVNAVVETPKGWRTKFKYDEKTGLFQFSKMMPAGFTFPFDFGFLPSTRAEDGDPLDVLILTEEPTFVGCLIEGRLLRILEAEQTDKGKSFRNDRLIVVPLEAKSHEAASRHTRLDDKLAQSIKDFFVAYNEAQGKKFKPLGTHGPDRAVSVIRESITRRAKKARK